MPFGIQLALFLQHYGYEMYRNDSYPTKDKIIPIRLFTFLSDALSRTITFNMSTSIHAMSIAGAAVMGGKESHKIHAIIDKIYKEGMGEDVIW